MKVSIIIRTYNEERHLKQVLNSIKKQTIQEYEIICVDSGSTDSTLEIIKQFDVKLIQIKKEDFNYSYASNIGCENATGDLFLFLSGHSCLVKKNYLEKLLKIYKKYKFDGCYGDLVPYFKGGLLEKAFYYLGYYKNVFKKIKIDTEIHPGILSCSNAVITSQVFKNHQFCLELGSGAEDVEMAKYILSNGGKIIFYRDLLVRHSHHKSSIAFIKETKKLKNQYDNACRYIIEKYGDI